MALLTDANIVTLDDLLEFENSLIQISSTHNIDVITKINLAISDISDTVMLWLLKVRASDPQWLNRRALGLSTVVVTPTLQQWLCFQSLSRFFAEAYNVQLNTRFQGKWTEYQQAASNAAEMAFMFGLGIVYNPLPRPGLPFTSIESGTVLPQALFLQTAWVDQLGNEGAISPVNGLILQEASNVSVAINDGAIVPPAAAIGWNIYASGTSSNLTRQNATPLATTAMWQLPSTGLTSGPEPINGQEPNVYIMLSKQIQRG